MAAIRFDGGVPEDVFRRPADGLLGVLVTQSLHVVTNIGSALSSRLVGIREGSSGPSSHQLLSQWHLLELHAMHASIGNAEQRSCCEDEVVLHRHNHFLQVNTEKEDCSR